MSELHISESQQALVRAAFESAKLATAMDLVVQGNRVTAALLSIVEKQIGIMGELIPEHIIDNVAVLHGLVIELQVELESCARKIEGE